MPDYISETLQGYVVLDAGGNILRDAICICEDLHLNYRVQELQKQAVILAAFLIELKGSLVEQEIKVIIK
jgi:hypothetical protein